MSNRLTSCLMTALIAVCSFAVARAQNPRTVLIEEFTSATCGPCAQATPVINRIIADSKYQGRVISIRYHMDLPLPGDPWYNANVPDNSARKTAYTISTLPASRIDGQYSTVAPTNEADMRTAIESELNGTTGDSPVKMTVAQSRNGNQILDTVKVTASQDISGLTLMVALVETHIHVDNLTIGAWNGEKDIYDVMRKLLPDGNGQTVTLAAGKSKTYTFNYTIDPSWQADQIYTVAFVQDPFDKSITQAAYSPRPTSSVNDDAPSLAGFSLESVTPNPASANVAIGYTLGSTEHVTIELHDLSGALVTTLDEGEKETGSHQARLDVSALPSGVYSYTIRAGRYRETKMVTVVR